MFSFGIAPISIIHVDEHGNVSIVADEEATNDATCIEDLPKNDIIKPGIDASKEPKFGSKGAMDFVVVQEVKESLESMLAGML